MLIKFEQNSFEKKKKKIYASGRLKQVVWERQKMHENVDRPSGSWIIKFKKKYFISFDQITQVPLGLLIW